MLAAICREEGVITMTDNVINYDVGTNDGTNVYTLGQEDTLFVGKYATLTATGGGHVVGSGVGTANYAHITVLGSLYSSAFGTIELTGFSNNIAIGATGDITSALGHAVNLYGGSNVVSNAGWILATQSGINFDNGGANNINNSGTINGSIGVSIPGGSGNIIVNSGNIEGVGQTARGIFLGSGGNFVDNSGTITGNGYHAIHVLVSATGVNAFTNSGVIQMVGSTTYFALAGGNSDDLVTNTGTMDGGISFGAGNDFYDGQDGHLHGDIFGGDGNDAVYGGIENDRFFGDAGNDALDGGLGNEKLFGGDGNDTLTGGIGADYLSGGSGVDTASHATAAARVIVSLANPAINSGDAAGDSYNSIENLVGSGFNDTLNGTNGANIVNGGAGNDFIKGYVGNDTLTGGAGLDAFIFNTALNAATNVDTITDFSAADDTIQLDNLVFIAFAATGALASGFFRANATGTAQDSNDHIVYETDTGKLFYDADGNGAGAAIQFARLTGNPAISAADFTVV